MGEWLADVIGKLPGWAVIPVTILAIIILMLIWLGSAGDFPFPARKNEWLEKTASRKKGKHGKK